MAAREGTPMMPSAFARSPALAAATTAGMAFAIAAVAGVAAERWLAPMRLYQYPFFRPTFVPLLTLVTLGYTLVWGVGFRFARGKMWWRAGSAVLVPAFGTATAFALSEDGFASSFVAGATYGVFFWAPAFIGAALAFGGPLWLVARARSAGLTIRDRAEAWLACADVVASLAAFLAAVHLPFARSNGLGRYLVVGFAWAGLACGLAGALHVYVRRQRRRSFLAAVARGERHELRIDDACATPRLVHVTHPRGPFRDATKFDVLFEIGQDGDVVGAAEIEGKR